MVKESLENPQVALGMCGCNLTSETTWQYQGRSIKGNWINEKVPVDFVLGCGGILVKPSFFDQSLLDYSPAPPAAFYVDDIWINGNLAKNKISRYVISLSGKEPVFFPTLTTLFTLSLDKDENRSPENNNKVIDYCKAYW